MTIDDKIRDEKLQYEALASARIDKYQFFTGEEILSPNQRRVIEQSNFTYSLLGKAFEKQANDWRARKTTYRC